MKSLCVILLSLLVLQCSPDPTMNDETSEYLDLQIRQRLELMNAGEDFKDTSAYEHNKIALRVNELILLSKDVENVKASINKSNSFLREAAAYYALPDSDLIILETGMRLEEITSALKSNELSLLNKIILKKSKNGAPVFTAQ